MVFTMSYLAKRAEWPKIAILNLTPSSSTWTTSNTPTFTPSLKSGTTNLPYLSISGDNLNLDNGCYYVEFWVGGTKAAQNVTGTYSCKVNNNVFFDYEGSLIGRQSKNRAEGCYASFTIQDSSATLSFSCTSVTSNTFTFVNDQCFAIVYKI
jgi:hypothetical protein